MNKNTKNKKSIWITAFVVINSCILALAVTFISHKEYETISLKDHWMVDFASDADMHEQDVALDEIPFSEAAMEDTIELSRILPENTIVQPQICLRLSHCAFDVYLDQQLIYSYGKELYEEGKLLGSGYFWIPLPEDCEGKKLSIRIKKVRESRLLQLGNTCIISAEDAQKRLVTDNFLTIVISVFLIIIAIIELGSVFLLLHIQKPIRALASISAFSFLTAVWMSCNNKTIQFLIRDYSTITMIEYIALYYMPVGVISIVYDSFHRPFHKKVMRTLEYLFLAMACVVVCLQAANVYHLPVWVGIYWRILLIAILTVVAFLFLERKRPSQLEKKIEANGLLIFLVFVLVDALYCIYRKNPGLVMLGKQELFPVGLLIWIEAMIVGFVLSMYHIFMSEMRHDLLMKIAYTDFLTAISNRTKCEEVLQQYEKNKASILLVNIDLNNFKQINDTYGHSEGDRALCAFANLLDEVFGKHAVVGRMGGDEFIIITEAEKKHMIEELLHHLTKRVNEYNTLERHPFRLQFAYGYATNEKDISHTPWDVYKEADAKMYECKRKQEKKE